MKCNYTPKSLFICKRDYAKQLLFQGNVIVVSQAYNKFPSEIRIYNNFVEFKQYYLITLKV